MPYIPYCNPVEDLTGAAQRIIKILQMMPASQKFFLAVCIASMIGSICCFIITLKENQ